MTLKKILVASKNANVVSLLKLGLGKDYEVSAAGINEEEILEVISKRKPNLIILEIVMPRGRDYRGPAYSKKNEVPILMLSFFEGATVRILDLGGRDFLGKKLTAPELKQRIEEAILRALQEKGP